MTMCDVEDSHLLVGKDDGARAVAEGAKDLTSVPGVLVVRTLGDDCTAAQVDDHIPAWQDAGVHEGEPAAVLDVDDVQSSWHRKPPGADYRFPVRAHVCRREAF